MNEPLDDSRNVWQNQPLEVTVMSIEEIREKAVKFERRINRRNTREYAACVLVIVIFSFYVWVIPHQVVRTGAAMVVLGTCFIAYQLRTRASSKTLPSDLGLKDSTAFHLAEMERQSELLRTVFWWYILPLLPGLCLMALGTPGKDTAPRTGFQMILSVLPFTLMGVAIWWLNRRGYHRLRREIESLKRSTPG